MRTKATFEEYCADDENIVRMVNRFLSLTIAQIRSHNVSAGIDLIARDVFVIEGFCEKSCGEMTFHEFLPLLYQSRYSDLYSYVDHRYGEIVSSYSNYLFYAEMFAVNLYNVRSECEEIGRLMSLPLGRLIAVLYKENVYLAHHYDTELRKVCKRELGETECSLEKITMEELLGKMNGNAKKMWTPTQMPIREYRTKRERMCKENGMLVIDLFARSSLCAADIKSVREKYATTESDGVNEKEQTVENEEDLETVKR